MTATTAPFPPRRMLVPAFGPPLLAVIGSGAFFPLVALMARDLGASVGGAALLVSGMSLGVLVVALPAGALIARVGERAALTVVGLAEALLCLLAWWTDDLTTFAACMVALGAASTVATQARQGFMIDAFDASHRARAMSALGGVFRLGMLIGPLLAAGLVHRYGLPSVFLLAAGCSLASVALVRTMPTFGDDGRDHGTGPGGGLRVLGVVREHAGVLLSVGSAAAVIQGARAIRFVLLPLWADHVGVPAAGVALMVGIASVVDLLFVYPAGWVMDRHGRAPVAACVVGSTAAGCLLLPLTDGFAGVLAVLLLISAGNGMGAGINMTLGADTAPAVGRSQYLGGWRLVSETGALGAPVALSLVAGVLPLAGACLVMAGIFALGTGWSAGWARVTDRRRTAAAAAQ